ncbi:MAG: hypothetical protein ACREE4_03835 [Stellaceae bacterium]
MTTALAKLQQGDIEFAYQVGTMLPQLATKLELLRTQISQIGAKAALERGSARMLGAEAGMLGGGAAAPATGATAGSGTGGRPSTAAPATGGATGAPEVPDPPRGTADPSMWEAAGVYVTTGKTPPALGTWGSSPVGIARQNQFWQYVKKIRQGMGLSQRQMESGWQSYAAMQSARIKAFDNLTSGQGGQAIVSFNTALDHINLEAIPAVEALKNNQIQVANALLQRMAAAVGKPAPTNFDEIRTIVGDELAKAIVSGGGGRVTEGDREQLQMILNRAESPEQLMGAIHIAENMAGQRLLNTRRQAMALGMAPAQFDAMLSPLATKLLHQQEAAEAGAAAGIATPDDVFRAIDAGRLTKAQGRQILIDRFHYRPIGH